MFPQSGLFGKYIFLCFHKCVVCKNVFPQSSSVQLCVSTKLHKCKKIIDSLPKKKVKLNSRDFFLTFEFGSDFLGQF